MSSERIPGFVVAIIVVIGVVGVAALMIIGKHLIVRYQQRRLRLSLHTNPETPTTPRTLRGKFSSFSFTTAAPPSVHLATDYVVDTEKGGLTTTTHEFTHSTPQEEVEDLSLWGTLRECRYLPMTHRERERAMGVHGSLPPALPERARGRQGAPRPLPEIPATRAATHRQSDSLDSGSRWWEARERTVGMGMSRESEERREGSAGSRNEERGFVEPVLPPWTASHRLHNNLRIVNGTSSSDGESVSAITVPEMVHLPESPMPPPPPSSSSRWSSRSRLS